MSVFITFAAALLIFGGDYSLADVYECDRMARAFVRAHL